MEIGVRRRAEIVEAISGTPGAEMPERRER
jgi:hypothetical protein